MAGSVNNTCEPENGQCFCKEFTFKRRCDRCVKGSSFLDENNPYGCSKGKLAVVMVITLPCLNVLRY